MSYSQWNVLQDELEGEAAPNLLGKLWHRTKQSGSLLLDIYLPVPVYIRGKAFCEDIEELSESVFTQADLINLLYHDWLLFAKRTNNLMTPRLNQMKGAPKAHFMQGREVRQRSGCMCRSKDVTYSEANFCCLI